MKAAKRRKLEAAGWRVGSADDFLDQAVKKDPTLKKDQLICPSCKKPYAARACGITHGLIAQELGVPKGDDPYGKPQIRRLKQRIANALWELPAGARKKIGEAIDAWAIAEKQR